MIYGGVKNIYCVAHHQTEEAGLMPMTIACHKAAKKVTMEYMEDTMGRGWWGSNSYADYYENLGTGDDPFSYIKVIPLIGKEAQHKCGGFDHAGKWETSLMLGTYPDHVDLSRCENSCSATRFKKMKEDDAFIAAPKWLERDKNTLSGKVIALPARDDIDFEIAENLIVELYSK